jgi:hypothetical protein
MKLQLKREINQLNGENIPVTTLLENNECRKVRLELGVG